MITLSENFRALFYTPFYAAQATGAFQAAGVQVDLRPSPSPLRTAALLRSGEIDVMWGGPLRVLLTHDKDPASDLVCFCDVVARDPFFVIGRTPRPGFRPADLTTVRLGSVSEVPTPWLCLQDDIRRDGADPDMVTRVTTNTMAENLAALRAGTLDAVKITAPPGTIVSATYPAAVYARSSVGHMMPDVVYGALEQAIPGRVPAEGTSNLWSLKMIAGHGLTGLGDKAGTQFMVMSFHSGGAGARPAQDGLSATPFPSGVRNVPVEATEAITPLVIWRKELRQDSGGAGTFRGGLGQIMEVSSREDAAFGLFAGFERVKFPARGRKGGGDGGLGRVSLASGVELKPKGLQIVPPGERLVVEMPGGGGMGPAHARDPEAVRRDVRLGYLSAEAAKRDYGVE
jgi:hypothetical protein